MIPYTTFKFFGIAGALMLPTVVMGLLGRTWRLFNFFVTLCFILLFFYSSKLELYMLIGYIAWELILVKSYLYIKKRINTYPLYLLWVLLSILPIIGVKLAPLSHTHWQIGFLGISYLTFKAVQIIIEFRDGQIKEVKLVDFLHFLLFFPTITSGPIDRYRRFLKDMASKPSAKEYRDYLYIGLNRIIQGFLYKFIVAYLIKKYWMSLPLLKAKTILAILCYMYAYSFYLFFDFAGYSAFAIGFSYLMAVKTPENFNKPFLSHNIKDFWNRWHMSLSFWFRDFVYMRFVVLLTKKKVIANKYVVSYLGFFLLFTLMGLWHGFELHYIVYGVYHAVLIVCFDWIDRKNKQYHWWVSNWFTKGAAVVITFHFIAFGFLIFSGWLFN
jgi:membrane protein involved in D-alanine export